MEYAEREAVLKFAAVLLVKYKIDVIDHVKSFVDRAVIDDFKAVLVDAMTMGIVRPWGELDNYDVWRAVNDYCAFLDSVDRTDDAKLIHRFFPHGEFHGLESITEKKFDDCVRGVIDGIR